MNNITLIYILINDSIDQLDNIKSFFNNSIKHIVFIDLFNFYTNNNDLLVLSNKTDFCNVSYYNNLIDTTIFDNQIFYFKNIYKFVLNNNNHNFIEIHYDSKITYKNIFLNTQMNFKLVTFFNNTSDIYNLIEYYNQLYILNIIYKLNNSNYDFQNIFFKLAFLNKLITNFDNMIFYYNLINNNISNHEIIYFKYLDIGKFYENKQDFNKALEYYYKAYILINDRKEAIYEITKINRIINNFQLSFIFSKIAYEFVQPSYNKYKLLLSDDKYFNTLFPYDISIVSYYIDNNKNNNFINNNIEYGLLHSNNENIRKNLINNYLYYIKPLSDYCKYNKYITFDINIENKQNNNNYLINPSIVFFNNKYIISAREINYHYHLDQDYSDWSGPNIYSNNHIIIVDSLDELKNNNYYNKKINFNLNSNHIKTYDNFFMGFEDIRLFVYNNKLFGICTAKFTNSINLNEMSLCYFDDNYDVYKIYILNNYNNHINQKNWCPIINNNNLQFLYSNTPTTQILQYDFNNNICNLVNNNINNINTSFFRGNTKLIWINDLNGYLYIIHEVSSIPLNSSNKFKRYYYHRFVLLDSNFNITKISPLFYLINTTIEFICGLELVNDKITISFGFEDKTSNIIELNYLDIKNILKDL